jgi:hypothetical protein
VPVAFNPKPPQHVLRPTVLNMSHRTAIGATPDAHVLLLLASATGTRQPTNHRADFKIAGQDDIGRIGNPTCPLSLAGIILRPGLTWSRCKFS